jgi:hypothetical protein
MIMIQKVILYYYVHAYIKMNLQKLNIKYLKSLFLLKLNNENTYSLDLFQIYTNVPIIYLKRYYENTCKNFNINLPFKIIKS